MSVHPIKNYMEQSYSHPIYLNVEFLLNDDRLNHQFFISLFSSFSLSG